MKLRYLYSLRKPLLLAAAGAGWLSLPRSIATLLHSNPAARTTTLSTAAAAQNTTLGQR